MVPLSSPDNGEEHSRPLVCPLVRSYTVAAWVRPSQLESPPSGWTASGEDDNYRHIITQKRVSTLGGSTLCFGWILILRWTLLDGNTLYVGRIRIVCWLDTLCTLGGYTLYVGWMHIVRWLDTHVHTPAQRLIVLCVQKFSLGLTRFGHLASNWVASDVVLQSNSWSHVAVHVNEVPPTHS